MKPSRPISNAWLTAFVVSHIVLPVVWLVWIAARLATADDKWATLLDPLPWIVFGANWVLNIFIFVGCALNYRKRQEQAANKLQGS